jgi:hypothetical protein
MAENPRPAITRISRGKDFHPDTVKLDDGTTLAILGSRGRSRIIKIALDQLPPPDDHFTALKVDAQLTIGVRRIKMP